MRGKKRQGKYTAVVLLGNHSTVESLIVEASFVEALVVEALKYELLTVGETDP